MRLPGNRKLTVVQYFAPDYELDVRASNMDNANSQEYLEKIRHKVVENLKRTAFAPSVQMTDIPQNPIMKGMDDEADDFMDDLDEDKNKDKRFSQRRLDKYTEKDGELSDSEDEEGKSAFGVRCQPGTTRRRNEINYRNLRQGSGLDSGCTPLQDSPSTVSEKLNTCRAQRSGGEPRIVSSTQNTNNSQ